MFSKTGSPILSCLGMVSKVVANGEHCGSCRRLLRKETFFPVGSAEQGAAIPRAANIGESREVVAGAGDSGGQASSSFPACQEIQ